MKYRISSKAQSDLIGIWRFTLDKWSVEQADRYYELIVSKIQEIGEKPDTGKNYNHFRKGYWGANVKSHVIFYKVKPDCIEVIRILHQRMDLKSRLKD